MGLAGHAEPQRAKDLRRRPRQYGWCLRAPDFRFRGVPHRCRLRYRAHASDPCGRPHAGRSSSSCPPRSWSRPSRAPRRSPPNAARRPPTARRGRRGLTAITASLGPDATSTLTCSSSFGPSLGARNSSLQGIALTPGGAWGVGFERMRYNLRRPVVVRNTSAGWQDVQARSSGTEDGLVAVAADGDASAWAVGFTTFDRVQHPLAMRWDGARWRVDRPSASGSLASVLTDVAVLGDGVPWAVGYRMTADGKRRPLAARREKKHWRYVDPSAGRRESVTLTGIASDARRRPVGRRARRSGHGHGTGRLPPRSTGAGCAIGCRASEVMPSSPTSWQRPGTTHGPWATSRMAPRCVRSSFTGTGATGRAREPLASSPSRPS